MRSTHCRQPGCDCFEIVPIFGIGTIRSQYLRRKIWPQKKILVSVSEDLVSEKSLGFVIETFGPKKKWSRMIRKLQKNRGNIVMELTLFALPAVLSFDSQCCWHWNKKNMLLMPEQNKSLIVKIFKFYIDSSNLWHVFFKVICISCHSRGAGDVILSGY